MAVKRWRLEQDPNTMRSRWTVIDSATPLPTIPVVPTASCIRRIFRCKTCPRALGGHRKSHSKHDLDDDATNQNYLEEHQCPICDEKFPIGQALCGHMRTHRKIENNQRAMATVAPQLAALPELSSSRDLVIIPNFPTGAHEELSRYEPVKRRREEDCDAINPAAKEIKMAEKRRREEDTTTANSNAAVKRRRQDCDTIATINRVRQEEKENHVCNVTPVAFSDDRLFKCKTCPREFMSFQALGGHTASHNQNYLKEHQCPICGEKFRVGQALGGHMGRHRRSNEGPVQPESSATATVTPQLAAVSRESVTQQDQSRYESCPIDLNLPAVDDAMGQQEFLDDPPFFTFL